VGGSEIRRKQEKITAEEYNASDDCWAE